MIETSRLAIRPIKFSDCEPLNELFADPEVMRYSINGTKTPEEVEGWVEDVIGGGRTGNGINIFAVVNKKISAVIGYCGLTHFPDVDGAAEIEMGYRLIREHWGHGYATEAAVAVRDYAFVELELARLVSLIEPTNKSSIGVATKVGMSYEKEVMLENYDHPDHLYSMKNIVTCRV